MNCNQCRAKIVGKPGSVSTKSTGGWCGSKRITRTLYVCQDCTAAGEYQQHLYRLQLQAEAQERFDRIEAKIAAKSLEQGNLF